MDTILSLVKEAEDRAARAGQACSGMVLVTLQYPEDSPVAEKLIVELARTAGRWANRILDVENEELPWRAS